MDNKTLATHYSILARSEAHLKRPNQKVLKEYKASAKHYREMSKLYGEK